MQPAFGYIYSMTPSLLHRRVWLLGSHIRQAATRGVSETTGMQCCWAMHCICPTWTPSRDRQKSFELHFKNTQSSWMCQHLTWAKACATPHFVTVQALNCVATMSSCLSFQTWRQAPCSIPQGTRPCTTVSAVHVGILLDRSARRERGRVLMGRRCCGTQAKRAPRVSGDSFKKVPCLAHPSQKLHYHKPCTLTKPVWTGQRWGPC